MKSENDIKDLIKIDELKGKERLYAFFYELTSEIKCEKIEIPIEEYEENIKNTSFEQLIQYIKDSFKILIKRKMEEVKFYYEELMENNQIIDNNNNNNNSNNTSPENINKFEIKKYENYFKNLESQIRKYIKNEFQLKLQREILENKIGEFMQMEEEFEEMKAKYKYEDGKFLNNDRKDNEIIILRTENSNIKKDIINLEKKIQNFDKEKIALERKIELLNSENKKLQNKLEEKEKEIITLTNNALKFQKNNSSVVITTKDQSDTQLMNYNSNNIGDNSKTLNIHHHNDISNHNNSFYYNISSNKNNVKKHSSTFNDINTENFFTDSKPYLKVAEDKFLKKKILSFQQNKKLKFSSGSRAKSRTNNNNNNNSSINHSIANNSRIHNSHKNDRNKLEAISKFIPSSNCKNNNISLPTNNMKIGRMKSSCSSSNLACNNNFNYLMNKTNQCPLIGLRNNSKNQRIKKINFYEFYGNKNISGKNNENKSINYKYNNE